MLKDDQDQNVERPGLSNLQALNDEKQEQGNREIEELIIPTWRLVVLVFSLCSGLFLSLLDTSIVATALSSIATEFSALSRVTWVALAYTLSYLGCAVLFASIGDVVGRRNAFTAAFIIFFGFSLGCGFSKSLNQLIACRALQGVGGSGLYSLSIVIFPEISPPKMKMWIASLVGAVVAIAGVFGPVVGGIITHYTTWRWVFWINAPMGILPMIMFVIAWPKPDQMRHAERKPLRHLDIVGGVLLVAASVLVVFALQEGGLKKDAWGTATFIAPLLIGIVCWVLLLGWEISISRLWENSIDAVLPIRLLKSRVYMAAVVSTILMGFPFFIIIFNFPVRLQVVNGSTTLTAGFGLLPLLASAAVASMVGGIVNGKKNNAFPTLLVASILTILGTGLLSTLSNSGHPETKAYGFQIFVGFGFGLAVSTVSILASLECEIRDSAIAQGILAQNRILGGSIGIAAATAILSATERRELAGIVSPSELTSLRSIAATLSPAQLHAVKQSYSDAFSESMHVCTAVSGFLVLATLFMYQRNPPDVFERRQHQLREHVQRLRAAGGGAERKENNAQVV